VNSHLSLVIRLHTFNSLHSGNQELLKSFFSLKRNLFSLAKGRGGERDYRPPVNSSEFLVKFAFETTAHMYTRKTITAINSVAVVGTKNNV